jgi:hypothetical protein
MRTGAVVMMLLAGWGSVAIAGELSKEECKRVISAEKKPMDACVEKKCRKLATTDMKRFQTCFDQCATEQSPQFAICYQRLLSEAQAAEENARNKW